MISCILIVSLSGLIACDDSTIASESGFSSDGYDIEGPVGIVTTAGPWLVRIGIPIDTPLGEHALQISLGTGMEDRVEPIDVTLVQSGRPDLAFALIPEVEAGVEVSYNLARNGSPLLDVKQFIWRHQPSNTPGPDWLCEVRLASPDPKRPVTADQDEAPWAGIQRTYQVEVIEYQDEFVDGRLTEEPDGVVLLDWLTRGPEEASGQAARLSLYRGRARSGPITTLLGIQYLRLRVFTQRGSRCDQVIELSSL